MSLTSKLAQAQEIETNTEEIQSTSDVHVAAALNLTWSFGINRNVPVLNLSNENRKTLFYSTAHTGVLYDFANNSEFLYQGHCNAISCACASTDKRWLATADIGQDCLLIVWDTKLNLPIKTIFDVDTVGITTMAFSHCAKFIVTLSCSLPQTVSVWDWTTEPEIPVATVTIDELYGLQTYVTFNANNVNQIVSNNKKQVIFYIWQKDGGIDYIAPELNDKDFNKTVGSYSQSMFQPENSNALTATSCGNIVVWNELPSTQSHPVNRKAYKIVKLQEKAITVLLIHNGFIVTGDTTGSVKFFDLDLKMVNWYNKLKCQGAINSISFTFTSSKGEGREIYPATASLDATPFVVSDFSVSTTKANYLYFKTQGSQVEFRRKESNKDIKAIACHPKGPFLAIGGFDGLLQVQDFETKTLVCTKQYTNGCTAITSMSYSHGGDYLAVGFDDGTVQILDSVTLEIEGKEKTKCTFNFSNESILKLVFSEDSTYLACSDMDRCVVVFKYNDESLSAPWYYLGKHRAHYKSIQDIIFTKTLDENFPRLMSIGEDRNMIEYDLRNSEVDDLKILSSERIEQDAVPICFAQYPSVVKESFLVVANNQFKMKLFNSTTKMCRHTFLAPTYGSPIQSMVVLPGAEKSDPSKGYMAYVTLDKVGLLILPIDGNPYKSVAFIAHPGKVHNLTCSYDGKYIFTAGGSDTSVLMWKVDLNALEAAAALGGGDLTPFYSLLPNGRDGELFAELEEYFYHAQMRNQGIDSMSTRNVSNQIPLSEIPFVMRALGFYPTEQQIDEMVNEVKFSEYVNTGNYVNAVDLGTFIKLYTNHRPAFGLSPSELTHAFETLGELDEHDGDVKIGREELLKMLCDRGEHLTESELAEYMALLFVGPMDENDNDEYDDNKSASELQSKPLDQLLPDKISSSFFTDEMLGITAESPSLSA